MFIKHKKRCNEPGHRRIKIIATSTRGETTYCATCRNKARVNRRRSNGIEAKTKDPHWQRRWHLKTKFGLTLEQYAEMLFEQNCVCAICGTYDPGGTGYSFCVDHDHKTGKVRSLLCFGCNVSIGHFDDSSSVAYDAFRYLESHGS